MNAPISTAQSKRRIETLMVQTVKAKDKFESQLFQWDMKRQVISLPHGKDIWFVQLGEDGNFKVLESKPKAQSGFKPIRK